MSSYPAHPASATVTPSWARRASKACASCRRDKIRCDGSRPCSGCKKKGYADDQCIDGCEAWRHARVRCEEGTPCRRCVEMGLECSADSPSTATVVPYKQSTTATAPGSSLPIKGKTQSASASGKTTRGGERAKLACSNCRKDNKKCDDQRPCSRCIARSEECIHLPRGPKLIKLRCEGCRMDNKRCEESRPCVHCTDAGKVCITAARKGRGHGTRVKAACVACRRDKIRCNGDRPCAACIKKGCECVERPCQACVESGKASECTHRKLLAEATPLEPEGPPVEARTGDYMSSEHFNTPRSMTAMTSGTLRPQGEPYSPAPHSQPLHSMYPPSMVSSQAQYYFPQQTYHSIQPSFQTSLNSTPFSGSSSQVSYYCNNSNDEGRGSRFYASSAKTSTGSDAFSASRRASG